MTSLFVQTKDNGTMPLARRMRPQTIDEMVGQEHLLSENGLLYRLLQNQALPSLILWGPPGSGKTTLAENLCRKLKGEMIHISAVMAGVKDIRAAIAQAQANSQQLAQKTYLFIDEIHRFNKSQQDALLPFVEDGTVTLLGATTENPSFSINNPLLSRCRVLQLKPLEITHFSILVDRALTDKERGLKGNHDFTIDDDARKLLTLSATGDARVMLSILEIAAELTSVAKQSNISVEQVRSAVGKRMLAYDRNGEEHYNVISAFIKSMRGSDPDAACYYLARMLEAGEEPRFICRRMVVFASEDIGNADPQAIQVAVSAFQAFEFIGIEEGYLVLAQAATYLASAPKSNASYAAIKKAKADVETLGALPVPLHICNAPTGLMKKLGYGKNYLYPHDFPGNFVKQQYLPDQLLDKKYYLPTTNGYERFIAERLSKTRN